MEEEYSIRVINEYDGNKVYTIEKQCRTYGQVMRELEAEGVKTDAIQLCNAPFNAPAFKRFEDAAEIEWGYDKTIQLWACERQYSVRVVTHIENAGGSVAIDESFHCNRQTTIGWIREQFEKAHPGCLPEIHYGDKLENDERLENLGHSFFEHPVLVGKLSISIADEKCNQIRNLAVYPRTLVREILKQFADKAAPPRVLHRREQGKKELLCREEGCDGHRCPHSWFSYGGRILMSDESISKALDLLPEETSKIIYYVPPPFPVTIKEKNDKNEFIETKIDIEDWNTIADVRNKYSRNAEEGLVEGDMLLLIDQELKEERMVFTYMIDSQSPLFVQKRAANQPMFTYICADCGNDLRLRKDEKIRCRECGHRVVYKPRLNKPLQHFAR